MRRGNLQGIQGKNPNKTPQKLWKRAKCINNSEDVDNLNTHFASSFVQVLGAVAAAPILERIQFHYTPKHASWLNMAELEIGIMDKQCTGRRMPTQEFIAQEVLAWQQRRNSEKHKIKWKFTCQDADRKLGHHYIT